MKAMASQSHQEGLDLGFQYAFLCTLELVRSQKPNLGQPHACVFKIQDWN